MKRLQRPVMEKDKLLRFLLDLTAGDRLYFWSFGLFMVTSILSTSFYYRYFIGYPYMWMQMICAVLLVGYEVRSGEWNDWRGIDWKPLGAIAVMFALALYNSIGNLTRLVAFMFLYIYSARNIPFAKIVRFTLKVSIITVSVIVFSGYLGIIENVVAAKGGRIREYLGFRYALFLPGILLNMTGLWIYLRKDTITVPGALVWAVINWFVYYKTDSRISFVIAEVLLIAALAMRFLPKWVDKLKPIWFVMSTSFFLFGAFSLVMTLAYDSTIPWMRKLNSMLESRLKLGHNSVEQYGFTFFGQDIEWIGNGLDAFGNAVTGTYTYVDCMYVKILQRYGILFTLLLVVLLSWSMYRLYKRKEYHLLLISASVAAHCVLDDLSFALHYNTFWIALGVVLLNPVMLNWNGKTTQINPPDHSITET